MSDKIDHHVDGKDNVFSGSGNVYVTHHHYAHGTVPLEVQSLKPQDNTQPRKDITLDPALFDPYNPALPPTFVGRKRELRKLANCLEQGNSVLVQGDFRIGKTSLLRTWEQQARAAGREVHFLDGQDKAGHSPACLVAQVTGNSCSVNPDEAADRLRAWAVRQPLPPLLLLDEAPAFVRNYPHRFFERLRAMLGQIQLVVSTPRDLDELYQEINQTSPFGNKLRFFWLGLLEPEAATELAYRSGQTDLLLHWAGCHPFYLQLFGQHLLQAGTEGLHPREVVEEFQEEAMQQLEKIWRVLSEQERQALLAAGRGEPCNTRRFCQRGLLNQGKEPFGEIFRLFLEEQV
ncbi:ATP-binding protein [Desulfobulbus sp. TB]|nr:ATP-binding protein [Desulfobulbus sp. TB]